MGSIPKSPRTPSPSSAMFPYAGSRARSSASRHDSGPVERTSTARFSSIRYRTTSSPNWTGSSPALALGSPGSSPSYGTM